MKHLMILMALVSMTAFADFKDLYNEYKASGFTNEELTKLYSLLVDSNDYQDFNRFKKAVATPYLPLDAHAGDKFYQALSWYKDTTMGNRDGKLTLDEITRITDAEVHNYLKLVFAGRGPEETIGTWKMIQKLGLLKRDIVADFRDHYSYTPRTMMEINHNDPWNALHTIDSDEEFQEMVIEKSFVRPVLVKFGLTYCVHCLLMENMGSVPAVEKKYRDHIELNQIAKREGVSSSPYFILYFNGEKINQGYVFPDHLGNGMEDFLSSIL
jgi:hypothetical protein